ncbi:hypothetical protein QUB56_22100 [Microcoleus sp. AR_TQ3_B6]|uniref:hypothetical protein n=1 Tax=Microcoleus sp. AR_TQ3_B6 TaxID=3055284 RepID=UPI002FD2834C
MELFLAIAHHSRSLTTVDRLPTVDRLTTVDRLPTVDRLTTVDRRQKLFVEILRFKLSRSIGVLVGCL